MFLHFDDFQPRNIFALFLFSLKQSDLLRATVTANINNRDVSSNNSNISLPDGLLARFSYYPWGV